MLFNSYIFIFGFLPVTLAGYAAIVKWGKPSWALAWVTLCSLVFYGWWNAVYLPLLIGSILINYGLSWFLITSKVLGIHSRRGILITGLIFNLGMLAYFKYANFFLDNLDALGGHWKIAKILLPLGISFFVFQKIAYLVDAYRGKIHSGNFLDYSFFVSFFPQLIAGPIVHHSDVTPQIEREKITVPTRTNLALGLTFFFAGLFSKSVIADGLAPLANTVFGAAANGAHLKLAEAWIGALAYTLQLYFDFSGYSYMAIGLGLLFNIKLPANFNSPYRATSIIDFWRRWHITLSAFLRDYLYIPLGGNRCGTSRNLFNLMATMSLGGLWHGASWTFVIWGAFHGLMLCVNHFWRSIFGKTDHGGWIGSFAGQALTFFFVMISWVIFRADNFSSARQVLKGMAGWYGISATNPLPHLPASPGQIILLFFVMLCALKAPNLLQIMGRYKKEAGTELLLDKQPLPKIHFKLSLGWAVLTGLVAATGICALSKTSEFLYFQF